MDVAQLCCDLCCSNVAIVAAYSGVCDESWFLCSFSYSQLAVLGTQFGGGGIVFELQEEIEDKACRKRSVNGERNSGEWIVGRQ